MTGRKLSKEHKRKISEYQTGRKKKPLSEEHKKRISEANSGRPSWNKGISCSEVTRKKLSKWNKGKVLSKETRQKMRDFVIKQQLKGFRNYSNFYKSGHYFSKKNNKEIYYRSSYELTAYKILEQMSKVKSYQVEPFAIQYKWENFIHKTIPDILITYTDGGKELIEVKPKNRLKEEQNIAKFNGIKNWSIENNIDFNIWTEKELGIY